MPTNPCADTARRAHSRAAHHWLSAALTSGYPQAANLLNEVAPHPHPVQP